MKPAPQSWLMRTLCVPATVHRRRALIVLAIALPIWGWFDVRQRGHIDPNLPGLHMTDLTVYTEAGAAFFDGRDPYRVTNSRGWSYLYPPLFAMLLAPLHGLQPEDQVFVWFGISCVFAWAAYRESLKLITLACHHTFNTTGCLGQTAGSLGQSAACPGDKFPAWIGIAAIATGALPACNCLQRGQVGILKLYLLLLGVRLVLERLSAFRTIVGGLVLSLAIALKITPLLPVCCLLVSTYSWERARPTGYKQVVPLSFGLAAGLLFWILLVPSTLVGAHANLKHLRSWWNTVPMHANDANEKEFAGNSLSVRNQSLLNSAQLGEASIRRWLNLPLGSGSAETQKQLSDQFLLAVRLFAVLILLRLAYQAGKTGDLAMHLAAFGLACAGTLVVSPIARVHYFVLLLPAMLFVPLMLLRHGRQCSAYVMCAVLPVLCTLHYAFIDTVGNWGLLGLGTTAWLFAAAVALLRAAKELISPRMDKARHRNPSPPGRGWVRARLFPLSSVRQIAQRGAALRSALKR